MKQNSTSINFDGLGAGIAQQGSSGPRIIIDAHMDELGGMVRRVTAMALRPCRGWAMARSSSGRSAMDATLQRIEREQDRAAAGYEPEDGAEVTELGAEGTNRS